MRAVKGCLVASKPVSLSKAAAILSRFAASGSCSRRDVSAHVRRASAAFDELVLTNRGFRAARKRSELMDDADEPRKKKRGSREEEFANGDSKNVGVEPARRWTVDRSKKAVDGDGGRQKKRRKLTDAEEERSVLYAAKDENATIPDGDVVDRGRKSGYEAASFGDNGVIGLESTNGKGAKKKMKKNPEMTNSDERSKLAVLQAKNGALEKERSERNEKRMKERKKEKNVNGAWVGGKVADGELHNNGMKEKVEMEEERKVNENKKKRKNKKLQ